MNRLDPFVVDEILKNFDLDELRELAKVDRTFRDSAQRVSRRLIESYRRMTLRDFAKTVLLEKFRPEAAEMIITRLEAITENEMRHFLVPQNGEAADEAVVGSYVQFERFLFDYLRHYQYFAINRGNLFTYISLALAFVKRTELKRILGDFDLYMESMTHILTFRKPKTKFLDSTYEGRPIWFAKITRAF